LFIFVEILSYSLAVAKHYKYVGSYALRYYQTVERNSQLLRDITCRSFVCIPWPSTLYCVPRGVFSSTNHI